MMDFEDGLDDFLEFVEMAEEEEGVVERAPRRVIRDAANPLQFYNDNEFRRRYRFAKNTVINTILPLVAAALQKRNNRGLPISPTIQLIAFLRFCATSSFQAVTGDLRGISQPTVSRIVRRVAVALAQHLHAHVHFPQTQQEKVYNRRRFYEVAHFPYVAGCIDCTHIKISNPGGENGEVYRNRKGFFSLNVQVVSGPHREIMDIVVRHPGSTHDQVIFERSALKVWMERGDISGLLVGDSGYGCKPYLLTPVLHPATAAENRYNDAHIATRNVVERLFGTWKKRFPCLQRGLQTKMETTTAIICATAVLHNISLREYGINNNDDVLGDNFEDDPLRNRRGLGIVGGLDFRRRFINTHFEVA